MYRHNLAELVTRLARAGRDDPSIAARLGITPSQVRGLRTEFGIPAGARRSVGAVAASSPSSDARTRGSGNEVRP